jgi:peptide/nickel transport system substrate-binding protein
MGSGRDKGIGDEAAGSGNHRTDSAGLGSRWRQHRTSPKARRDAPGLPPRQPGEHVDPRRGDGRRDHADDGVFNNLVLFDQHVPQNNLQSIVPELATSWAWSEDGTELTFKLRDGVKWHDGKPFTADDVKCTFDLLTNQGKEKFRLKCRETWWVNVANTTTTGDHEATLHLKRPQPALLALLASGDTPIYPCHVAPRDMRQHPIGTGPFKFVDYKPNQYIKLARNPDYWKPGRPYLDGIEYTIIPNRSTAILAFIAGNLDMTFPYEVTIPLLQDIKTQAPQAICEVGTASESIGLLTNRTAAPFDNAELRRAMALTLDRKSFIDILGQGEGELGGALLPPPEGVWGMPAERLRALPGYGGNAQNDREEARAIMQKLGYGPNNRLPKISARNLAVYRDPAAILIDQLKEIYIDGELETVETANWVPKLMRKDFNVGLNVLGPRSTTPTSISTRTTCAALPAITPAIATRNSTKWSTSSRRRPIRRSARSWHGTSITSCSRSGAPDHLSPARRDLLATPGQGADHDGQ